MQHGDAAVELGLHIGITGGREGHLTEFLVLLADGAACERRGDQASGKQNSPRLRVHHKSPLWLVSGLRATIGKLAPLIGYVSVYSLPPDFDCCGVACKGVAMRKYASVQGDPNRARKTNIE